MNNNQYVSQKKNPFIRQYNISEMTDILLIESDVTFTNLKASELRSKHIKNIQFKRVS